ALDQAAGQNRAGAKQGPPVPLAQAVGLAAQVEGLPHFGGSEQVKGGLPRRPEAAQRLRLGAPQAGVELLQQPAARVQGVRCEPPRAGRGEPRLPPDDLRTVLRVGRVIDVRGTLGAERLVALAEEPGGRARLPLVFAPADAARQADVRGETMLAAAVRLQ